MMTNLSVSVTISVTILESVSYKWLRCSITSSIPGRKMSNSTMTMSYTKSMTNNSMSSMVP